MIKDRTTAYAKLVVSGKKIAGRKEYLACKRHLDDLKNKKLEYKFDVEEAEFAINFANTLTLKDGRVLKENDYLSLNGSTGEVYAEHIEKTEKEITGNFSTFMSWVDMFRRLKVKANADTIANALK